MNESIEDLLVERDGRIADLETQLSYPWKCLECGASHLAPAPEQKYLDRIAELEAQCDGCGLLAFNQADNRLLRERVEELEAACAAKDAALEKMIRIQNQGCDGCEFDNAPPEMCNGGCRVATEAQVALSPDAGKGWLSPEEAEDICKRLRGYPDSRLDGEGGLAAAAMRECERLEAQAESNAADINRLREQLARSEDGCNQLTEENEQLRAENERLSKCADTWSTRANKMRDEAGRLRVEREAAKAELEAATKRAEEVERLRKAIKGLPLHARWEA